MCKNFGYKVNLIKILFFQVKYFQFLGKNMFKNWF